MSLLGQAIAPGDPRYDEMRAAWNLTVDQHPTLIVVAQSAADIAEAVHFARAANLPVAVQATGHGVIRPADDSLLIVTSEYDPDNRFSHSYDLAAETTHDG